MDNDCDQENAALAAERADGRNSLNVNITPV